MGKKKTRMRGGAGPQRKPAGGARLAGLMTGSVPTASTPPPWIPSAPPPRTEVATSPPRREKSPPPPDTTPAGVEQYLPPVLAVTHWFEPTATGPVTLRLSGRRLGPTGRPRPGARFEVEETVHTLAGSGPVAVTSKIAGLNAGEWDVTAKAVGGRRLPVHVAGWSWLRWRLRKRSAEPVRTRVIPFSRAPGLFPGAWTVFALLGVIIALAVQSLLVARLGVNVDEPLMVSLVSILAGGVGGKLWYLMLRRKEGKRRGWIAEGWAVQGFVAGAILAAAAMLALRGADIGGFLDATAPALLFGMGLGRLGCFFTGCCAGRATTSRWGVWSSDRRLGMRRVPTQLLESALALTAGLGVLAVLALIGPVHGALFVAIIALYTLICQGLLCFRAEQRRTRIGSELVALLVGVVLMLDAVYVAVSNI